MVLFTKLMNLALVFLLVTWGKLNLPFHVISGYINVHLTRNNEIVSTLTEIRNKMSLTDLNYFKCQSTF